MIKTIIFGVYEDQLVVIYANHWLIKAKLRPIQDSYVQ